MGCSPPGSSVHGISQARILEWVAISFSRQSSWPRNWIRVSCIVGRLLTDWATREALALVHLSALQIISMCRHSSALLVLGITEVKWAEIYFILWSTCDQHCRKTNAFQGSRVGSYLTLGNELSKETHMLTRQEILLGRGAWVESTRVREPRSIAQPCGNGVSFQVVSGQSFWLMVLPSGACIAVKMDSNEKDFGRLVGHMDWHFPSPFDLSRILLIGG